LTVVVADRQSILLQRLQPALSGPMDPDYRAALGGAIIAALSAALGVGAS
jgi:hypothetical protein